MEIAVVVVSYRNPCSRDRLGLGPDPPVVWVDNGEVRPSIRETGGLFRISPGRNLGFARGMNLGLRALGWDLPAPPVAPGVFPLLPFRETPPGLAFLVNADARITGGSLDTAARWFRRDPHLGVLGPLVRDLQGVVQPSARGFPNLAQGLFHRTSMLARLRPDDPRLRAYLHPLGPPAEMESSEEPRDVDWVSGAAMMVRRAALETVQGFDERFFMYAEDIDLCMRLRASGWAARWWPGLKVTHAGAASSKQHPEAAVDAHHRSLWRYYNRWLRRNALEAFAVGSGLLLRQIARLVAGPRRGL